MRACTGTTKQGKPCKAAPLKDSDKCLAHTDEQTRASVGFGGSRAGAMGGRPKKPRVVDVILASIEERADELLAGLWEAAKATKAVVVGNGPSAFIEMVPDYPTRLIAKRELLDRGYGRPKQTSDITVITQDWVDQQIAELEAELAGNDPDRPEHSPGEDRAVQAAQS